MFYNQDIYHYNPSIQHNNDRNILYILHRKYYNGSHKKIVLYILRHKYHNYSYNCNLNLMNHHHYLYRLFQLQLQR